MRYAIALVALLIFEAGQTLGQTLAPAGPGFDLWPIAMLGILGVGVAALIIWHKRNPSQADAAIADAKNEGFALAHKIGDALQNVTKANRDLTMVAISPPIQAAVNAAPAPPPASTVAAPPAPPATPDPAPPVAATPAPYPPPGMPPDQVFYNAQGIADPLGQYHDYQLAAVKAQQQSRETDMATGPLDPASLSRIDLCYLSVCAAEMTFDARQLGQGLFYGPGVSMMGSQKDGWPEMSAARANFAAFEATVSPMVAHTVWQMAQGAALAWMRAAFPAVFADARLSAEYLASWSRGWQRLHPAPA